MRNVEATRYSEEKRRANRLGGAERAMGLTALGLVLNACVNLNVDQDALDSLRQVLLNSGLGKKLKSEGGKLKSEDFDFDGEIKNLDLSKFVFKDDNGKVVVPDSWEKRYEGGRTKVKAIFEGNGDLSEGAKVKLDSLRDKAIEYVDGKFSKGKSFGFGGDDDDDGDDDGDGGDDGGGGDNSPPVFDQPKDAMVYYNIADDSGSFGNFLAKDSDSDDVSYSLTGKDKNLFQIVEFGNLVTLVFKETPDPYHPLDSNRDNIYEVGVEASDGRGGVAKKSIMVDGYHRGGSDNPYVWVLKEGETRTDKLTFYGEDASGYTLEGADASLFHIVDGALKFRDAQAYDENGDNTYDVVVVKSAKVKPHFTVRVVDDEVGDTNRAPVFDYKNSDKYPSRMGFYEEGKVFSFGATDPDGDVVRYLLKGTDRDSFDIDSAGNVSFKESPLPRGTGGSWGDGSLYIFAVVALDGKGGMKEAQGYYYVGPRDSSSVDEAGLLGYGIDGAEWF